MSELRKGDYVLIEALGHRKHGRVGILTTNTASGLTKARLVDVDGVEYWLMPHELTKLVREDEGVGGPTPPDLTTEEYNEAMDALMARAATAPGYDLTRILTIADSIKNKFDRHAEHHRTD